EQAQRDMADQQKIRDAFMQANGDMDKTLDLAARSGVQPKTLFGLKAQVLEQRTKMATLTKDELANAKAQSEQIANAAQSVLSLPPEQRTAAIQQAIPQLVQDPQQAQQMLQSVPQDPAQQEQWLKLHALSATSAKDQIERIETERHNKEMEKHAGGDSVRFTQNYLQANNLPDTPANRLKAFQAFTKETKTDPAVARTQVFLQRPVEVGDPTNPGQTTMVPGTQSYGMPGKSSASVQIPRATEKYMTSGKGGQQITAYNTAIAHLDTLRDMGAALGNGNIQRFNAIAQKWSQETGNPAPASFDAARAALAGEVASALKASGATDQEIAQVEGTFSKAQSPKQINGVIATYQTLLRSKRQALMQQNEAGMKGKPAFNESPSATPETRTYQGATYVKQSDGSWKRQ